MGLDAGDHRVDGLGALCQARGDRSTRRRGRRLRKIAKDLAGGHSPDRDTQFERITRLIAQYETAGNPYFSMDTKAKEHLGSSSAGSGAPSAQAFHAFDHDFPSWAEGVLIPHGIEDRAQPWPHQPRSIARHKPVCLRQPAVVLEPHRQAMLPEATSILGLVRLRRQQCCQPVHLQTRFARAGRHLGDRNPRGALPELLLEVQPDRASSLSPYHPTCHGMLFDTLDTVVTLMRKATTSTGLRTTVNVMRR